MDSNAIVPVDSGVADEIMLKWAESDVASFEGVGKIFLLCLIPPPLRFHKSNLASFSLSPSHSLSSPPPNFILILSPLISGLS